MSKIKMYYAAMNGGKTSALLQASYNYESRGKNVLIIKSEVDTKGGNQIVSRTGMQRKVDIKLGINQSLIEDYGKLIDKAEVILVDEAQFLSEEQVNELWYLAEIYDKKVQCYGLKTDFKGNFFPGSKRLFEIANTQEITTSSICKCGDKAEFNARWKDGDYIYEGEQVLIDGDTDVEYDTLCPKCYLNDVVKYKKKVLGSKYL